MGVWCFLVEHSPLQESSMFGEREPGIAPVREIFLWAKGRKTRSRLKRMGYKEYTLPVPFGRFYLPTTVFLCPSRHEARFLQRSPYLQFRILTCFRSFDEGGRSRRSALKDYRALHVGMVVRSREELPEFSPSN